MNLLLRMTAAVGAALLTLSAWAAPDAGSTSNPAAVRVVIDAEFGVRASTSAQAIALGAGIAAAEINARGGVLGRPLEILTRNNNSIPARAAEHLRELARDPQVVAVMGGKHSPVVLELLPLIHELGMPYLAPWSAADGITNHGYRPGYVFRLSLRDSWALDLMIDTACREGRRRLAAILPNSSWGRSSLAAIEAKLLRDKCTHLVGKRWYSFGEDEFARAVDGLGESGADVVMLVANEAEGAAFVREIARRPASGRLPILAHWGITGGEFPRLAGPALADVDLRVVQTFSFLDTDNPRTRQVRAALSASQGRDEPRTIESPVGVAHAYDLIHLLALAIERAGSTERKAVRDALVSLGEHHGLVRDYRQPFSEQRFDALDPRDVFLARYARDGAIEPVRVAK